MPIVLFLGRIHHLKGLDVLVEAMRPLLDAAEAVLAVVGRDDGSWDEIAARHAGPIEAGRLRFIGPLYGVERFHAYADADVFALTPRHWEETSVAALEAGACGTALVLTEQADIPGLVASGRGLVTSCTPEAVREAVVPPCRDRTWGGLPAASSQPARAATPWSSGSTSYLAEVVWTGLTGCDLLRRVSTGAKRRLRLRGAVRSSARGGRLRRARHHVACRRCACGRAARSGVTVHRLVDDWSLPSGEASLGA